MEKRSITVIRRLPPTAHEDKCVGIAAAPPSRMMVWAKEGIGRQTSSR